MNEAKQKLTQAEQKAKELFDTVVNRGLITPGKSESNLIGEIVELAKNEFGVEK